MIEDPTKLARMLLESATSIANAVPAKSIIVAVDALPDLDAVPPRTLLITREEADEQRAEKLGSSAAGSILVPNVTLDRMGQVKLAAVIALAHHKLELGDTAVFLTGPFRSIIDTLVVMTIGAEYELFDTTEQQSIHEHIRRAVFHKVLTLALQLGQHGREGRKTGALFVIGDHDNVLSYCEQMILNPFKGYERAERNVLDDAMSETVKEYSILDGAFIISGTGVIETAGARIKIGTSESLPKGLGARHAAAAGITSQTDAIAMTVSESDGTVRVWRAGRILASFESQWR